MCKSKILQKWKTNSRCLPGPLCVRSSELSVLVFQIVEFCQHAGLRLYHPEGKWCTAATLLKLSRSEFGQYLDGRPPGGPNILNILLVYVDFWKVRIALLDQTEILYHLSSQRLNLAILAYPQLICLTLFKKPSKQLTDTTSRGSEFHKVAVHGMQ